MEFHDILSHGREVIQTNITDIDFTKVFNSFGNDKHNDSSLFAVVIYIFTKIQIVKINHSVKTTFIRSMLTIFVIFLICRAYCSEHVSIYCLLVLFLKRGKFMF